MEVEKLFMLSARALGLRGQWQYLDLSSNEPYYNATAHILSLGLGSKSSLHRQGKVARVLKCRTESPCVQLRVCQEGLDSVREYRVIFYLQERILLLWTPAIYLHF